MNFRQLALVVATALALPIASHAQETTSPITRAQVRAELAQLEKAGYRPGGNDPYYPNDVQAAEAKVAAGNGTLVNADSDVGDVMSGTSASGARIVVNSTNVLYAHH